MEAFKALWADGKRSEAGKSGAVGRTGNHAGGFARGFREDHGRENARAYVGESETRDMIGLA